VHDLVVVSVGLLGVVVGPVGDEGTLAVFVPVLSSM
jgi:hypothetical protein